MQLYMHICVHFFLLNNASTFDILPILKGLAWIVDDKLIVFLNKKISGFETPLF